MPLPPYLEETLKIVMRYPGCDSSQVQSHIGGNMTLGAMTNRLADLVGLGLITREREGKSYHYTAK